MINILLSNTQLVDVTQDKHLWVYVTVWTGRRIWNYKFKTSKWKLDSLTVMTYWVLTKNDQEKW